MSLKPVIGHTVVRLHPLSETTPVSLTSGLVTCANMPCCIPGVSGLEVKIGGKPRSYALLVADTVVVKPGGATPEVLTAACNKAWSDVAYFFKVSLSHQLLTRSPLGVFAHHAARLCHA